MPSAVGKRVGRVLAGCSKPEAEDKPGLPYLAGILGSIQYHCIGHLRYINIPEVMYRVNSDMTHFSDTLRNRNRDYAP